MRFAKLSQEKKLINKHFLTLYQAKHLGPLGEREQQELDLLSILLVNELLGLPLVYLSARELALSLGVSYYQVKKWIEQGYLKANRTPGGHYELVSAQLSSQLRALGYTLF